MAYIFEQDGDYVNFNGGGNLWRLHKDSNCVAWHWDESGDLFFDVYDQAYVVKAENIGTVTVGGVTLTAAADFATEIVNVFTGLSSGGGSSLLSATVELTDAQIKALPTGFEIISAPGVGKILFPVAANFVLNIAGVYTGDAASASWNLIYSTTTDYVSAFVQSATILTNGLGIKSGMFLIPYSKPSVSFDDASTTIPNNVDRSNLGISIKDDWNGSSPYTGGNAANTLKVTVYYVEIDL
jgi:hypothetical protein